MTEHPVSRLTRSIAAAALVTTLGSTDASELEWKLLEPGLELGRATFPDETSAVTPTINVLRIDPDQFEFGLFNASAKGKTSRTPKQWSDSEDLVAVINASMFQEDLVTSVSMMRNHDHINNAYKSKDRAMLVFNPIGTGAPPVRILDKQCEDFDSEMRAYKTVVQSIRMISCKGVNVWKPQIKKWSTAAIGMDKNGSVLFIQTETAFATHDLINELLALPIGITRAMYVEGGPQAQLYVASGGKTFEFVGQLSPIFSGGGPLAWPLPNVIGISRKTSQ